MYLNFKEYWGYSSVGTFFASLYWPQYIKKVFYILCSEQTHRKVEAQSTGTNGNFNNIELFSMSAEPPEDINLSGGFFLLYRHQSLYACTRKIRWPDKQEGTCCGKMEKSSLTLICINSFISYVPYVPYVATNASVQSSSKKSPFYKEGDGVYKHTVRLRFSVWNSLTTLLSVRSWVMKDEQRIDKWLIGLYATDRTNYVFQ